MPNVNYLQTTAVPCGTKFIIGSNIKDSTFQPGSVGYMGFTLGVECNCPNVMYYNTVIIRKGNKGKLRVEHSTLLAPVFNLPDVPMDLTISQNDERRYFVDMCPLMLNTEDFTNIGPDGVLTPDELTERKFSFLGFALAKGLFLQELDATSKPIDHPLMKKLNLGENPKQRVFSSKKKSTLQFLISDVESMVRDGRGGDLNEYFWNPQAQATLLKEIRDAEVALTLPMLEYSRKVNGVRLAAVDYVITQLEGAAKKTLPNYDRLMECALATQKAITEANTMLASRIGQRLSHIVKNRELVKDEVPGIGKIPTTSDKKVTHVFSGNQG